MSVVFENPKEPEVRKKVPRTGGKKRSEGGGKEGGGVWEAITSNNRPAPCVVGNAHYATNRRAQAIPFLSTPSVPPPGFGWFGARGIGGLWQVA